MQNKNNFYSLEFSVFFAILLYNANSLVSAHHSKRLTFQKAAMVRDRIINTVKVRVKC